MINSIAQLLLSLDPTAHYALVMERLVLSTMAAESTKHIPKMLNRHMGSDTGS